MRSWLCILALTALTLVADGKRILDGDSEEHHEQVHRKLGKMKKKKKNAKKAVCVPLEEESSGKMGGRGGGKMAAKKKEEDYRRALGGKMKKGGKKDTSDVFVEGFTMGKGGKGSAPVSLLIRSILCEHEHRTHCVVTHIFSLNI